MNNIKKYPIEKIGYDFISDNYLPPHKDEYYLRFQQNPAADYRHLNKQEITILIANGNRSDNWNNIYVRDGIDIHLIEECTFYGLVRIGRLESFFLEFSEFRTAVGLYRSLIVSCDIGNNVAINNVRFLSHYIIEDGVILTNINEMSCTSHSKFGNGILKDGEGEDVRIWMELCNENAGRKVLPFDGMLPGDAWLWTKYRGDDALQKRLQKFTEEKFDARRGYYGTVGQRTVIKNSHIIKDVKIGSDAYIKGANKLKNLTINSTPDAKSQIGEGSEMVNGIMGPGCRAFYGIKAVRFILAPFSQLKYGARLINSYLGENSTISCCEVLNSLIFPAHEQHHNNSFLCASLLMGQTNMAAGATIGSNHNSRGADGEIVSGRGFWPGLCVSLKHNSKFASFIMIAKGDFPAELNIPLPFSLIANEVHTNKLIVMPAYWMMYNMYAILRNEKKFFKRDRRIDKRQYIEYDFLAPDTINEIFTALDLLELFTGKAFFKKTKKIGSDEDYRQKGKQLLQEKDSVIDKLNILATGFENSKRQVQIIKAQQAYDIYKEMIVYYATCQIFEFVKINRIHSITTLKEKLPVVMQRSEWINAGGQLISKDDITNLIEDIKKNTISGWDAIHEFYVKKSESYQSEKLSHAVSSLLEILNIQLDHINFSFITNLFQKAVTTKEWITQNIYNSKLKDYKNPFRMMVYDSIHEMENVLGKFEDNVFINEQNAELSLFKKQIHDTLENFR